MSAHAAKPTVRPAWLLLALLACLLAWAAYFEFDQAVHAQGQVMPLTRTQVIQAADGGVLEKLMVNEGDRVRAGQVLAMLEKERASAGVDEGTVKVAALSAALIRARAEAQNQAPVFPAQLRTHQEFVTEQQQLYRQKRISLEAELAALNEALELADAELKLNERLLSTGDISRIELMRSKRQVLDLNSRIESVRNKYLQDARTEAAKLQEELASQRFKLEERHSVLQHTELVSPVNGVVKALRITTVGGVLRAGDELMQISPTEVELVIEAKVLPADIGQLRTGLPVSIKLDAFDASIYGALSGQLTYISSDTLTEQGPNGQPMTFYRAQVRLDAQQANAKLHLDELKPGMTAGVDIQTGSRTVLTYLLKPIAKSFQGAGAQR